MSALLFISISAFVMYLSAITLYRGIPDSISDTYYIIGYDRLESSLFTWFCWIVAMFLLPYWMEHDGGILAFLACTGLGFVGSAPLFKSHQKTIHFASAVFCFLSAYAWLLINSTTIFFISLSVLGILCFVKKRTFWWEVTAFVSIYTSLILTE
jgi:hypothetical protein